uniref:Uncharacterized protein n=1 Tax=Romanomermis culicivorax TaxID=13658 RepID=A0A915L2R0_ROMCU
MADKIVGLSISDSLFHMLNMDSLATLITGTAKYFIAMLLVTPPRLLKKFSNFGIFLGFEVGMGFVNSSIKQLSNDEGDRHLKLSESQKEYSSDSQRHEYTKRDFKKNPLFCVFTPLTAAVLGFALLRFALMSSLGVRPVPIGQRVHSASLFILPQSDGKPMHP